MRRRQKDVQLVLWSTTGDVDGYRNLGEKGEFARVVNGTWVTTDELSSTASTRDMQGKQECILLYSQVLSRRAEARAR